MCLTLCDPGTCRSGEWDLNGGSPEPSCLQAAVSVGFSHSFRASSKPESLYQVLKDNLCHTPKNDLRDLMEILGKNFGPRPVIASASVTDTLRRETSAQMECLSHWHLLLLKSVGFRERMIYTIWSQRYDSGSTFTQKNENHIASKVPFEGIPSLLSSQCWQVVAVCHLCPEKIRTSRPGRMVATKILKNHWVYSMGKCM